MPCVQEDFLSCVHKNSKEFIGGAIMFILTEYEELSYTIVMFLFKSPERNFKFCHREYHGPWRKRIKQ